MKLATYQDGSRDGQLIVVSRDLASAHFATGIASRMQQLLDDWNFLSPQLEDLYATLNHGKARHVFAFDPRLCMAPLPRAGQWVSGGAYPAHLARLQPATDMVAAPVLQASGADHFLGPTEDAVFSDAAAGVDFEAGLAVITGDLPRGSGPTQSIDAVRLLTLVNAWALRERADAAPADGPAGPAALRPAPAFAPVALTPDELGEAWKTARVHLKLHCAINGKAVGALDCGVDMKFHFGKLLSRLAGVRRVGAGSIVGSGAVSHADPAQGFACLAEKRAHEAAQRGEARTPWLQADDQLRIEMKGRDGSSLFGAIQQRVRLPAAVGVAAASAAAPAAAALPGAGDTDGPAQDD